MRIQRLAHVLLGVLAILIGTSCVSQSGSRPHFNADLANRRLDEALTRAVTDENGSVYRNAAIYVDLPGQDFTYAGAAGIARADSGESMTVSHQFSAASVGKTMTSAIIYQLWEEGMLGEHGLDATLSELDVFPPDVIDALHEIDGVSYGHLVTIRHLLTHTSGLRDVARDDATSLGEDHPESMGFAPGSLTGFAITDPDRGAAAMLRCVKQGNPTGCSPEDYTLGYTWPHWDYEAWKNDPHNRMAGLLNFYLSGMNEATLCQPGECFHYSDTNYIILGLAIERLSGHSLHHELRTRIFDPLHMDHTYLSYAADPPATAWEGTLSDRWAMNEPLISDHVNLSSDWGGGGVVSTVGDLNIFIRALGHGDLFMNPNTLAEMSRPSANSGNPYASGIIAWPIGDVQVLHHNGANGSWIEYFPTHDLSIAGTSNDEDHLDRFVRLRADIYQALAEAGLPSDEFRSAPATVTLAELMFAGKPPAPIIIGLLIGAMLIELGTLIIWPVSALRARAMGEAISVVNSAPLWVAATAILAGLIFVIAFALNIISDPMQLMFGLLPGARLLLWLPYLLIALTFAVLVFCGLAWRHGMWSVSMRIYYTVAGLSLVALTIGLVGLRLVIWFL
jgi:D-alanyl-D-alanine carboxypeptidase